jgi:hypothetical protein
MNAAVADCLVTGYEPAIGTGGALEVLGGVNGVIGVYRF